MKQWLGEPLLHFLVLGGALFAVYAYRQRGERTDASHLINVSAEEVRQRTTEFEAQTGRPPTAEELTDLLETDVEYEVLYREALAAGLDQGDNIIRDRLVEKMQRMAESTALGEELNNDELVAWYEVHKSRFELPSRMSFHQFVFSTNTPKESAESDANAALKKLANEPNNTKIAAAHGGPPVLQDSYQDATPADLERLGPHFAESVAAMTPGRWQGPIESEIGWHLIFVDSYTPGHVLSFEEAKAEVEAAVLMEQKSRNYHEAYQNMRAKYHVDRAVAGDEPARPAKNGRTPK